MIEDNFSDADVRDWAKISRECGKLKIGGT
jgi:hypothetical protein